MGLHQTSGALALVPEVVDGLTLPELARGIEQEHQLVVQAGTSMIEHAIKAGEMLVEAKAKVEHGEWERWLLQNFPDRHPKTHRLYMRLATHQKIVRELNPARLSDAHALLAGRPQKAHAATVKDEARELRKRGLTYQQIADQLGVSTYAVQASINPKYDENRRRRRQQETAAGRRALHRSERDRAFKAKGGALAEAYSLLRRALQEADRALETAKDRDVKAAVRTAITRMHLAEDELTKAVKQS